MKTLVTGGAGFIGTHVTKFFSDRGDKVAVFDNLSRRGSIPNLLWLQKNVPGLEFIHGDVRDAAALERAAQVAEQWAKPLNPDDSAGVQNAMKTDGALAVQIAAAIRGLKISDKPSSQEF